MHHGLLDVRLVVVQPLRVRRTPNEHLDGGGLDALAQLHGVDRCTTPIAPVDTRVPSAEQVLGIHSNLIYYRKPPIIGCYALVRQAEQLKFEDISAVWPVRPPVLETLQAPASPYQWFRSYQTPHPSAASADKRRVDVRHIVVWLVVRVLGGLGRSLAKGLFGRRLLGLLGLLGRQHKLRWCHGEM